MTEPTKGRGGRPSEDGGLSVAVFWGAGGTALLSLAFYAWVGVHHNGEKVEWWGQMGSGIALFSALFNAGALLSALSAVHLQRRASYEAGESTRKQLETMSSQLAEFAKSARAQQELAASQKQLAAAQERANVEAAELRLSQHGNTIAILDAALAGLKGAEIQALAVNNNVQGSINRKLAERIQSIGTRIAWELAAEQQLLFELGRLPPQRRGQDNGGTNA